MGLHWHTYRNEGPATANRYAQSKHDDIPEHYLKHRRKSGATMCRMKAVAHRDPKGIGLGMQQIGQGMTEVTKRRNHAAASGHSLDLAPATNALGASKPRFYLCARSFVCYHGSIDTGVALEKFKPAPPGLRLSPTVFAGTWSPDVAMEPG